MPARVFDRIVACVDGRPSGLHAGAVAIETAARFNSGVIFVTVLPKSTAPGAGDLERLVPTTTQGKTIQQVLEELQQHAKQRGVDPTGIHFLRGTPAEALLEYVTASPPDLLVVGTRGLSRGSRILLGSVSSRLVTDAPCPVLVARDPTKPKKG
jgi:nucleotide-binding universal stress UspA family protein